MVLPAFQSGIERSNRGYVAALKHVVRLSHSLYSLYCGLLYLTYLGFKTVPTGFIPQQDQGYLIVAIVLPDAASIDRTDAVLNSSQRHCHETPGVEGTFAITGFNLLTGTNQTNWAVVFLPLKSFHEPVRDPANNRRPRLPAISWALSARSRMPLLASSRRRPSKAWGKPAVSRCWWKTAPGRRRRSNCRPPQRA